MSDIQLSAEKKTRLSLAWAIKETCIRLPMNLQWDWRDHLAQLEARIEDKTFSFHVAAERRGSRKVRIAVLTVYDDHGKATWEALIPPGADGVEARE